MGTSGGTSGGGLPSWFQSGTGSPNGVVTPTAQGAVYQDTTNGALYEALSTTNSSWVLVGGNGDETVSGISEPNVEEMRILCLINGQIYIGDTTSLEGFGNGIYYNGGDADGSQNVVIELGNDGNFITKFNDTGSITTAGGATIFSYAGAPDGNVTALAKGDFCIDTSTPALWQASAAGSASWTEVGSGGAPGTTVESFITSNVSMSAGSPITITSVSLAAGTWEVTGRAQFADSTSELTTCDLILSPTNNSVTGAYAGIGASVGHIAGADEIMALSITKSIVLAVTTTVYLIGYAGTSNVTASAESWTGLIGNCTGITAVRTA